jgi:hypothetical protein
MHAAGVVISDGPLWDHVPVFCPEPGLYVTQFHKDDVEYAGLVKFDFLGLKTLTTLKIAIELVNKRPDREGNPFDLDRIAMDDPATYALLQSGETTNVFQLESTGMQSLIKRLKPDTFEDIVALCALYRPGPLGSGIVEEYVEGKHGRKKVEYPHPSLESSLKDTFGVMVYQEQVMQAAREMAGFTLGGADLLRRAMGKKKPEEMAKQKEIFVSGSVKNGHMAEDAERVFELMSYFSGYGFNKSHSAAYALIAYQCAYMKAHYPVEFLDLRPECEVATFRDQTRLDDARQKQRVDVATAQHRHHGSGQRRDRTGQQRCHTSCTGRLHDLFRTLGQYQHRTGDHLIVHGDHVVDERGDVGQRQLAEPRHRDAVGDGVADRHCHRVSGGQRRAHGRRLIRLHPDDPRLRPTGPDRRRDPRDQPATADGDHDRAGIGDVVEDVQTERALSGDDVGVLERVHEHGVRVLRMGGGRAERSGETPVDQLHRRTVA